MSKLNFDFYYDNENNEEQILYANLRNLNDENINYLKTIKDLKELEQKLPREISYFINSKIENLLNWYSIDKNADVLEINSCLGGLTQYLCDNVKSVTSVELSKTCSEIINERLNDKDNLEIFVGKISDIIFEKKFDYIILNDILILSRFFFPKSENPYKTFIEYIKTYLKPSGKIIIIAQNRFGIKNWAGALDEFTNTEYVGLQNYYNKYFACFSQSILKEILSNLNLELNWYYPIPSQFLPVKVLSEKDIEENKLNKELLKTYQDYSIIQKRNFNEMEVIKDLILNKKFYLFANSYLIIAENKTKGDING